MVFLASIIFSLDRHADLAYYVDMKNKDFWYCNVCNAQNSTIDGECQFCECGGTGCKRDNCDGFHADDETQAPR